MVDASLNTNQNNINNWSFLCYNHQRTNDKEKCPIYERKLLDSELRKQTRDLFERTHCIICIHDTCI